MPSACYRRPANAYHFHAAMFRWSEAMFEEGGGLCCIVVWKASYIDHTYWCHFPCVPSKYIFFFLHLTHPLFLLDVSVVKRKEEGEAISFNWPQTQYCEDPVFIILKYYCKVCIPPYLFPLSYASSLLLLLLLLLLKLSLCFN